MSQGDQLPPQLPISAEQARTVLQNGELDHDYGMLRWSSNYAFLVGVTFEDITLTAVYKPQQGERPLWDFPDGTLCYREYASYLTSEELSWDIVPPTALKQGKRGLGSAQFFIDHDPDIHYFTFDATLYPQLRRIALFDVLTNNADRKGGHCLLDASGHIWGIDHGIAFHSANKLRTVIWDFAGQPVPDDLLADVERLCVTLETTDAPYRIALTELLSAGEIRAFQKRIRHILETCTYPLPGAGPNYPWPPV
jgi:uncharacterized repeat protein (TIGR03843 family)